MTEPYRFGRFTLDPAERRLRADGAPVPLGGTAFNILLTLVEGRGEVVTKEKLFSRVWGHSVVGDNRLHVHINALRKLVGDGCIVTKQGRGYRFMPAPRPIRRSPRSGASNPKSGNLPLLQTAGEGLGRLVGRDAQLRALSKLLSRERLVTLTGPGGVGKTRLALHAASGAAPHFPDGAWLVELAALNDPDLAPGAVAAVLGIKIGGNAAPIDALSRRLARRTLLIMLDNCEHVVAAATRLCEAVLGAAPGVKILATSREALSCSGEQLFEVPPLEVPLESATQTRTVRAMPAVELFAERARAAGSAFRLDDKDVCVAANICRRLDGLPLAIEIVAGWAGVLGLEALEAEFDSSVPAWTLAGNIVPPRHATLGATLEWSYGLLSVAERTVLCRLAAFAGGFTLEAAKAVVGDDTVPPARVFEHVGIMIRKSMITVVPGARRYRLLETTRAFMHEKLLASDEAPSVRRRHAGYVLRLLERAMGEWETTSDAVWLARYGSVLDDLRAALDWTIVEEPKTAVALAGASWPLWRELSLRPEGRRWLGAAVVRLDNDTPPAQEARLRLGLGDMLSNTAAVKAGHAEFARAAALYRQLAEEAWLGSALAGLGSALLMLGRIEEADVAIREALKLLDRARCPRTLATAYSIQLCIEASLGRYDVARAAGQKSVRLCEMSGSGRPAFAVAGNLMELALQMNHLDEAVTSGRRLAARFRDTTHSDVLGFVLGILAGALVARGDLDEALTVGREAAPLLRDEGMLFWLFDHLALRAGLAGLITDAARLAGYSDAVCRTHDHPREPIGCRAIERLTKLLRDALTGGEISQLAREGALLTEQQALTLALRS
ncbi:MAG TPA: winged helix-turn-helix domain-containing protein [Rhizomicrobium sp.]|jgi:predicted ATPase/DNA-binding winged helix-turn-helix (wHTH) protein